MRELLIIIATIALMLFSSCKETYTDNKGRKYQLNKKCINGYYTNDIVPYYDPSLNITTLRPEQNFHCTSIKIDTVYLENK